ncbi:MAG: 4-alpha-glucanotransferase [Spirochaetales bacterium]
MMFSGLTRYLSGVLVPVSALRSDASVGVGEFADLPRLAAWCAEIGLDLIQILPVNDTGWQASPYSALSAFALHPLYLRIADLPEFGALSSSRAARVNDALEALRAEHADAPRLRYGALVDAKTELLRLVYDDVAGNETLRREARAFVDDNPWVGEYAAYKMLKARFGGAAWKEWPDYRDPTPERLGALWSDPANERELVFHVWVQRRLDEQFRAAAHAVAELGIVLKGDLPILINEDSVDTWAHRSYFSSWLRAGAPPDAQSAVGQNWGLPIYDWMQLEHDGYRWWKDRLRHAARYYKAYRIDHVLGFFRVWSIPADDVTGYLGHFNPTAVADRDRLHAAGMDNGRIKWLAEPHVSGTTLRDTLGEEAQTVIRLALNRIEGEDLYLLAPTIRGERDILALDCSDRAREWLLEQYRDRALIRLERDTFVPVWSYGACSRFQGLGPDEQDRFRALADELARESERLWEEQGKRLLAFMREATGMLPCAEDLGAIPACVPGVLSELRILGLRIPRWTRLWHEPGQPYIPPTEYPFLTVCAPSVHDTSSMRGWWREEPDRRPFWRSLGLPGDPPAEYDAETARKVTEAMFHTGSALCVFQIQDLLALVDGLAPENPDDERVNVPGTMTEANWSYRMSVPIEDLHANHELHAVLAPMLRDRRRRVAGR